MFRKLILIVIFAFLSIQFSNAQNENQIIKAMKDEMQRSLQDLKIGDIKAPYFIEYKLKIKKSYDVKATLGSLISNDSSKYAILSIGIRIGDYKFDNTNFFDVGLNFFGSSDDEEPFKNRIIPYEIDYNSLRRELWLATDAAYKQAVEIYTKKESTLKNRLRKDTTYDFTRVTPQTSNYNLHIPNFNNQKFEILCKNLSEKFLKQPSIFTSSVSIEYLPETTYYVNSESMEYVKNEIFTGLEISAFAQAQDGMGIVDFYSAYSKNPDDLPNNDSLTIATEALIKNISNLLKAKELENPYSGPVLFESQAAAELFSQAFAPNLIAQRSQLTEGGMQQNNQNLSFQNKIGGRVLPEFLSVNDIPAKSIYKETPLVGTYKLDDDGLTADSVNLVDKGFLKSLLSDRVPTKRIKSSNGHKRGGAAMYSVLELKSEDNKEFSNDSLRKYLIKLCKDRDLEYGIIIKKIVNQNILYTSLYKISSGSLNISRGNGAFTVIEAYKLYQDGKEELIKSPELNGLSVGTFKDILAVSKNKYALNLLAPSVISPFTSGSDQYVQSSVIVPDLLFEDVEIKSFDEDFKKLPLLSNPIK